MTQPSRPTKRCYASAPCRELRTSPHIPHEQLMTGRKGGEVMPNAIYSCRWAPVLLRRSWVFDVCCSRWQRHCPWLPEEQDTTKMLEVA